jgi:hypothetical protein
MLGLRPISTAPLATQISAVTGAYTLTITSASVVITGQTVTLRIGRQLAATAASVSVTGQTVTLRRGYSLNVTAASVPVAGQTVTLRVARRIAVTSGTVPVTGQSVSLRVGRQLTITAGTVEIAGQTVTLTYTPAAGAFTLDITPATIAITGQSVALRTGRKIAVTAAAVPVTGQSIGLRVGRSLAVTAAAAPVTGQSLSLRVGRQLAVSSGAVAIIGQTVTLTYTPVAGASVHVDSGSRPAKGRKARRIRLDEAGLPNPEAVALVREMLASVSRETKVLADGAEQSRHDQDLARRLAEEHEIVVRQLMTQTPATLDLGALLEHARSLDGQVKQLLAAASNGRVLSGDIDSDASDDDDLILLLME